MLINKLKQIKSNYNVDKSLKQIKYHHNFNTNFDYNLKTNDSAHTDLTNKYSLNTKIYDCDHQDVTKPTFQSRKTKPGVPHVPNVLL